MVADLVDLLRGDQQRVDCLPKAFPATIGAFALLAPFGIETSRPPAPEPEPASVTECGPRLSATGRILRNDRS
ncbi:hypothetical protein [Amycolatopsis sp. DG1A-15b]|uniref:hypothetical protein n=1 Tax=Amycolatopsis sp. DG1A-15b TaxID=3052846 RepID=UPI00255C1EEC|nr:hypothetical protein [Amycolatopsis sp. DG1A-15b]WIX88201.1 hypothetical protein QRY02_44975 [Amycolatopsis sp. DG1A-15b]